MKFIKKIIDKNKKENTKSEISSPWGYNTSANSKTGYEIDDISQHKKNPVCPQCNYPLLAEPSPSTPCPSCEFNGLQQIHDSTENISKTEDIKTLEEENIPVALGLKFYLIDESNQNKIEINSDSTEIVLKREDLDPDNSSISRKAHITMRFHENAIYVTDSSSYRASFIQIKDKTQINQNCKFILGNKILSLQISTLPSFESNTGESGKIGSLNILQLNNNEFSKVTFIDERTGNTYSFSDMPIILNRGAIDPLNNSISSKKHAVIENIKGNWFISDHSSNKATFIQLIEETKIAHNTKLVLGNKIFRFMLS